MECQATKRTPRRRSIQFKLNVLVIGNILAIALGLMLISYYFFCQRVDERFEGQIQRAAEACAENVFPGMIRNLWNEVNTDEFRALRERAEATDDETLIRSWMDSRPSWFLLEEGNTMFWGVVPEADDASTVLTLYDDYDLISNELAVLKQYLSVDGAYCQTVVDGVTYNLVDPDEKLYCVGSVEEPIEAFAEYRDNSAVPPITYEYPSGWLYTAIASIRDEETGEAVATAGVDIDYTDIVNERFWFLRQCILFVALLLGVAIVSSVLLLRRTAVRPLRLLSNAATQFAKEDRAFTKEDVINLEINSNDEIGDLYHEIRSMEKRIVDYTEHLTAVTAEKERVSTELRTASQIQESMLPSIFPAFPDREEFDLYASMTPAKEVGGDFYDFFLIDDNHLAVLIADVSDKGVPAALFMMSAKILINYRAQLGGSPSDILEAVNAQICKNNKSKMFVTVWLGILNLKTGILKCANAGHEYPMIRGQDGVFRLLKDKHGLVVGAMDRSRYTDYEIRMLPGDAIFVYTDGVPEANNADGEFYGAERMEAALNRLADCDPQHLLLGLKADVDAFTGEARQFDDLTMLCLEYRGMQKETASNNSVSSPERI